MKFIENNKLSTKKMVFWTLLAIFFVTLDRFLKFIALEQIYYSIVSDFFNFSLAKNYFIAFSIPFSGIILNYIISIILLILIFNYLKTSGFINISFLFIILGAASNLFDRFKYGYVVDYFNVKWFAVFNIADAMIVCAILFLLLIEFKKNPKI